MAREGAAATSIDRVLSGIERLGHADIGTADADRLTELAGVSRQVRAWLSSVDVAITRRTGELHAAGRAGSPEGLLAGSGGQSAAEARAAKDRADLCDNLPLFESALHDGDVTTGHLDAIAKATRNMSDAAKAELLAQQQALLAAATTTNVDRFGHAVGLMARDITARLDAAAEADLLTRQRKQSRLRHWIDGATGMGKTLIELDPERHAALIATIDAHLATLRQRDGAASIPFEQLKVDAVVELIATGGNIDQRRRPDVTVIVDWATLHSGIHATTVCESSSGIPIPVTSVQRLCCEATIHLVTVNDVSDKLAIGRADRIANREQRRMLAALHRTCAHPDCQVAFDHCQIHHITPWEHGGLTDLDNLIPLCSTHHHLVHEGRWTIRLHPDRSVTWTRPDGTPHFSGHTADRIPTVTDRLLVGAAPPGRQH
jgi:hypothetical protein